MTPSGDRKTRARALPHDSGPAAQSGRPPAASRAKAAQRSAWFSSFPDGFDPFLELARLLLWRNGMYKVKKILVAVDLSSCSLVALQHALALAAPLGAKVDVLYVAELPAMKAEPEVTTGEGTQSLRSYLVDEARGDLNEFVAQLSSEERSKVELLVDSGRARERILKRAADGDYDLLVMGTQGRTGRALSLAGSVTESVVRMAACPVLTVRERD